MKELMAAFLIGIMICFATMRSCNDIPPSVKIIEVKKYIRFENRQIEVENKKYQRIVKQYKFQTDSLVRENKILSCKLSKTQKLLRKQRAKKATNVSCDIIRKEVILLISFSAIEDPLCIDSSRTLNQSVAVRGSQIAICNTGSQSLCDLQKANILREQQLTVALNVTYKRIKKKRNENKILFCGQMIMKRIKSTPFIQSQQ